MNINHFDNRAARFISIIADDIRVAVADDFHGFVSNNSIQ